MPITLAHIYRFPVKGLRGEALDAVTLTAGQGVPDDRRFALARGGTRFDPAAPHWLPKQWFMMLMRDATLARLGCRVDLPAGTIELRAPGQSPCSASFSNADGRARLERYVNDFLGPQHDGPVRWVEAGQTSLTDVPQNCLSLINLDSVRTVEAQVGRALDALRFRANLYVHGAPPWAEFDWVGREIQLGTAALHIAARIPRCAATSVAPDTGERDINLVKELRARYGHYDMGVYAEVVRGGPVTIGDALAPPSNPRTRSAAGHWLRFFAFLARGVPSALRRR